MINSNQSYFLKTIMPSFPRRAGPAFSIIRHKHLHSSTRNHTEAPIQFKATSLLLRTLQACTNINGQTHTRKKKGGGAGRSCFLQDWFKSISRSTKLLKLRHYAIHSGYFNLVSPEPRQTDCSFVCARLRTHPPLLVRREQASFKPKRGEALGLPL